ncbi:MAG: dTDP-4-dehydrorhamnose 3,5-epimerase [Candidatus Marinamargulisbacteria bacterium]
MQNNNNRIEDQIILETLTKVKNPLGDLYHISKSNEFLEKVKEIYASTVLPGHFKGWKKHIKMTQKLVVPMGNVEFLLFDDRVSINKKMQSIIIGVDNYQRLIIPPNVWYGFRCHGDGVAIIINTPDMTHDPTEVERLPLDNDYIPIHLEN